MGEALGIPYYAQTFSAPSRGICRHINVYADIYRYIVCYLKFQTKTVWSTLGKSDCISWMVLGYALKDAKESVREIPRK